MNLFWRLVIGFTIAVFATLGTQRITGGGWQGQATMSRVAVMNSPIALSQGTAALGSLAAGDPARSRADLGPLEDSGVQTWLVTQDTVIGSQEAPSRLVVLARRKLDGDKGARIGFGGKLDVVQSGGMNGVLVMIIPSLRSPLALAGRTLAIIVVPVIACFLLARLFSAPLVRVSAAASSLASGSLETRVGKVSGPSEVQDLAKAFDRMAERIEAEMTARARLLADVSHEIRSPLARLRLAATMLAEGNGEPGRNIDRIQRDISRLDDLVESLRLAVPSQRSIDSCEMVRLEELVADCVEAAQVEGDCKNVRLVLEAEKVTIQADPRALHSLVDNVLRNAVIHAPEGSQIEVTLMADPPLFSVRDRGPGVREEDLTRIFEPFFRESDARERDTGGTGLGLAIVRSVAVAHGGQAWAQNRPDGGLIVSVTLPASLVAHVPTT